MSNGRFKKGHRETPEQKQKRIEGLRKSWLERESYTNGLVGSQIHNCWRAFKFTIHGKKVGNDPHWDVFNNFYKDMASSYVDGYKLLRQDKTKPFSKENCFWAHRSMQAMTRCDIVHLEYKGESLSLREWAFKLNLSLHGIRNRYFNGHGYSVEQILFGKGRVWFKKKWKHEDRIQTRASKLISSYRHNDAVSGLEFDLDKDWFIKNILLKECFYCSTTSRIGADRIDNSIGHIKSNVVPCCNICNAIRGDRFTIVEMKEIGIVINKINQKRSENIQVSLFSRSN